MPADPKRRPKRTIVKQLLNPVDHIIHGLIAPCRLPR
jgi:hypothetical protein